MQLNAAQMQALTAAAAAFRAGRAQEALRLAMPLPGTSDVDHLRALAHSALGQTDAAEKAFAKALKGAGRPGEIIANHANMLLRVGEASKAADLYARAAGRPGAPPGLTVSHAKALVSADRPDEAVALLLAADPAELDNPAALNVLGMAYKALEKFSEARTTYDRALAKKPDYAEALVNRAHLLRLQGDSEAAGHDLARAVQHGRSNLAVTLAAARHLAQDGQPDAAEAAYLHALRLSPQRADIHAEYNRYLWETHRRDRFLQSYNDAKNTAEGAQKLKLLIDAGALALRAEGREDDARRFFAGAASVQPDHPVALAGMAEAAPEAEQEAAWRLAMEKAPQHPDVRLGFAWYLLNHARAEEAEEVLLATKAAGSEQLLYAYDSTAARMLGRERYAAYYDLDRITAVRPITPPARYGSIASFLTAVEEALEPLFQRAAAPVDQTLFGGQQTAGSLWETANPTILALRDALMAVAQRFWDELDVPPGHPLSRAQKRPLGFGGSWAVKLASGGGHTDHVHPKGIFSSAHYVRVPGDIGQGGGAAAGCLRLGRPNLKRIDLPPERVIRPEEGTLILFPSYMWHGVEAFQSNGIRITTPTDFVESA